MILIYNPIMRYCLGPLVCRLECLESKSNETSGSHDHQNFEHYILRCKYCHKSWSVFIYHNCASNVFSVKLKYGPIIIGCGNIHGKVRLLFQQMHVSWDIWHAHVISQHINRLSLKICFCVSVHRCEGQASDRWSERSRRTHGWRPEFWWV